jgi:hypothetical protein
MAPYTGRPAHAERRLRPEPAPTVGIILLVNNQAAVGPPEEADTGIYREYQGIFEDKFLRSSNINELAIPRGEITSGAGNFRQFC